MAKKITREVDTKMKCYGDVDLDNNHIRVNPKKGGLLNTIIHENLHIKHPRMSEKNIAKKATQVEKKLSIKSSINLLKPFLK